MSLSHFILCFGHHIGCVAGWTAEHMWSAELFGLWFKCSTSFPVVWELSVSGLLSGLVMAAFLMNVAC